MAYSSDQEPQGLSALTTLANDDEVIVGDTSDSSEVVKRISWSNIISMLGAIYAPLSHTHTKSEITDLNEADYATAAQGTLADSALQSVSASDVGLGNVDNTADADKPVSTATQTALDGKVDDSQVQTNVPAGAVFTDTVYDDTAISAAVALNTAKNSYPSADATKLAAIEAGATADQTGAEIEAALDAELGSTDWKTGGGGSSIEVEDEGTSLTTAVTKINFVGSGVTASEPVAGEIDVTVAGGGAPVDSVNGATGVVVLDADDIDDASTTNRFATAAQLTKVDGVASGATANDTDANLLNRANHTGTQTAATISDFDTEVTNNSAVVANTAKVGVTTEEANPQDVSQAEAEAGTVTANRTWTPQRVAQAIAALAPGGGTGDSWSTPVDTTIVPDNASNYDIGSAVLPFSRMYSDEFIGSEGQFSGLVGYGRAASTEVDLGTLGAAAVVNWLSGTHFEGVLDQNCVITHSNELAGQKVTVALTGAFTPTFSDVDQWGGGTAPVALGAGETLLVTMLRIGTTVYGSYEIFS